MKTHSKEVSGLSVRFGGSRDSPSGNAWNDHNGPAWRVRLDASCQLLPMPFVRRRDAEMAMQSIENFTDWTVSREEIRELFKDKSKRDQLRELMVQNLGW